MKLYSQVILIAALAIPAFCQEPPPIPAPAPSAELVQALTDQAAQLGLDADQVAASAKAAAAAARFFENPDFETDLAQMKMQIDSADFSDMKMAAIDLANQVNMSFFQAPQPKPVPPIPPVPPMPFRGKIDMGRGSDRSYDAGLRALDQHKYDEAVQDFDAVINSKSTRAEGALYWKAYALNREGKRDDALAALAQLRRDFASSAWLNDAQALEAEVRQSSGQPVPPAQESNDDLKLLAINSLMNADPEHAIPLVEGILKGSNVPAVKDRALFVLSQNRSPQAQQALVDYAKGGGNPDLQLRAIQYLGMSGTKEAQQQLASIYGSSTDVRLKTEIVHALMMAHGNDALLNIAKTEKDVSLRDTGNPRPGREQERAAGRPAGTLQPRPTPRRNMKSSMASPPGRKQRLLSIWRVKKPIRQRRGL
jgi:TolA-binding protein